MPLLDALAESDLADGRPCPVRLGGRGLLVLRVGDELHAVDNLCPQDGTPLAGGELVGTILRCDHHGGRYDLATGRCLRDPGSGPGEDLRRYHARLDRGRVLVQVESPLAEVEQARIVASLRAALIDADLPRLARDCVRLLAAAADPIDALRAAVRYGAERSPDGFGPALAACADFARIVPVYEGLQKALPLTQALAAVALGNLGRHQRPIPEQARGVLTGSAEGRRAAFLERVAARDAEGAESLLSGALWQGLAASEARQWLLAAASARVLDGGAALVRTVKALDLCEVLGMREALHVLPPLVPTLVYGLPDDRAPGPVREVSALIARHAEGFALLLGRSDPALGASFDDRALRLVVLDGTPAAAFDALHGTLSAGVPPGRVGLAVALAAAERALRFDEAAAWDDAGERGWQAALAPFATAVAALRAVTSWPSPETLRTLFSAAALVARSRELDLPEARRPAVRAWPGTPEPTELAAAVLNAIRGKRGLEAACLVRGHLERGHDGWPLAEALARYVVGDALPSQAQVEQGAALVVAAVDAWEVAAGHPDAWLVLALAARVLGADGRHRFIARAVTQAIARAGRGAS